LLRGDGTGRFTAVDLEHSGLEIRGQVRDLKWLRDARGGRSVVAARNNDALVVLRPARETSMLTARGRR
jgi:hypothetical protein